MIIGRERELKLLEKVYKSRESEFVVVYGRRRVGKTYLIREYFKNRKCQLFHTTGLQKGTLSKQLKKFTEAISETFFDGTELEIPKKWDQAFSLLHKQITKLEGKVVIFLDELPWMASRKSGLLEEIDYYWNHYWSRMPNIILIVCGSSASWLIHKIIYNRGGLHNRVTCNIKLSPFNLHETLQYLSHRKIKLNQKHILSLYMVFGGIPYYLRYIERGLTAEQNIQHIIFDNNAPLKEEFNKLFDSLFENSEAYLELINLIAKTKEGVARSELKSFAKLSTGGGRLSKRLEDLCETGFIEEYIPWSRDKGEYYKLIDEFTLFHLHWVGKNKKMKFTQQYWVEQSQRPSYYAWSGYAFESVCIKHINQIINVLGIKATGIGSWRFIPRIKKENGVQIDLIIDRSDNAITLCEIKHTDKPFVIDKKYAENLKQKISIFKEKTNAGKQIFIVLISANGIKKNNYSEEIIDHTITLDNLFSK